MLQFRSNNEATDADETDISFYKHRHRQALLL